MRAAGAQLPVSRRRRPVYGLLAASRPAVQPQEWRGLVYSSCPILGLSRMLLAEGGEHLGFERHERCRGDHLQVAWSGQVDGLNELHSPWASRHDVRAVGQENGLIHIVRHEHNRLVQRFPEPEQPLVDLGAIESIEGAEGLVQQEDLVLRQDGPEERGALPHTTREGVGIRCLETLQAKLLHQRQGARPRERAVTPPAAPARG